MKLKSLLYTALALLASGVTQSCVNDMYDCPDPGKEGKVQLKISLNLGDLGQISRADGIWNPSGETEGGSTFDNSIALNTSTKTYLHVMLINSDDELLHLDLSNGFELNPVSGGYDLITELDLSDPDMKAKWTPGNYRLMVIANFQDRPAESKDVHVNTYTTLSELQAKIDATTVDWLSNDKGDRNLNNVPKIPMWGITSGYLKLEDGSTENFSIDLLRSVAKIRFLLTDRLLEAGYRLVKCEVPTYNKKIYTTPAAGWSSCTKTTDLTEAYYDTSFHDNASKKTDLTITAPGYSGEYDGDNMLVFYLPERKTDSKLPNKMIVTVANDIGDEESCEVEIDNSVLGAGYYKNDKNNINRNHLYQFTLDKDIEEGELTYKIECWNLQESAIGWNPDFTLESGADKTSTGSDSEANLGMVTYPCYSASSSELFPKDDCSFADYRFTIKNPSGAVWKAFLVEVDENGVEHEYTEKDTFNAPEGLTFTGAVNTPSGFFFGVGNQDAQNSWAVTTGIARDTPYIIKVGCRLKSTDMSNGIPATVREGDYVQKTSNKIKYLDNGESVNDADIQHFMVQNSNAQYWKNLEKVPTCYLVIKVAIDGVNFTERLKINPEVIGTDKDGKITHTRKFYGDDYRVEIRQLFNFYVNYESTSNPEVIGNNDNQLILGKQSKKTVYQENCWWGTPMGYPLSWKENPPTPDPEPEPEPEPES